MSYQLAFWDRGGSTGLEPHEVYQLISSEQPVEGLSPVEYARIVAGIQERVPGWTQSDTDPHSWGRTDDPNLGWNIDPSASGVIFFFYGVDNGTINQIIDMMFDQGMATYDPQTRQFFDGTNEPDLPDRSDPIDPDSG